MNCRKSKQPPASLDPSASENLIQYEDNKFYESDAYVADSTLFDVLTYEFKEGNPKKALTDANTVVISEPLATKLFGNESALNKSILISQGGAPVNYKITGVYKHNNSFLKANFITSMMSEGTGQYIRSDSNAVNEWAGQNFVQGYLKVVTPAFTSVTRKENQRSAGEIWFRRYEGIGSHQDLVS